MGYRLPRIEFSRTVLVDVANAAIDQNENVSVGFELNVVGESPWVNDYDLVLTQIDVIESGTTLLKKNLSVFLYGDDLDPVTAGTTFEPTVNNSAAVLTEAQMKLIKAFVTFSASYLTLGSSAAVQYNKDLNLRFGMDSTDSVTLFGRLVMASATVTYAADSKLLLRFHFALQ